MHNFAKKKKFGCVPDKTGQGLCISLLSLLAGVTVVTPRLFGIFGLAGQVRAWPDMKSRCPDCANTFVQASQKSVPALCVRCMAGNSIQPSLLLPFPTVR